MPQIKFLDRAKETTSTTGSGTVTLGGASAGFVALSGIGSGNYSYYVLEEASNFEIGQGTYSSVGNTFSRDTILSTSNSDDSKINLGGTARIFLTYPSLFLNQIVVSSGDNSVKLGPDAGLDSVGTHSISIGPSAGVDATGNYRVSIGNNAGSLQSSIYGDKDISIGRLAGYGASGISPGSNIHIGFLAGYLSDGRNDIHIGESAGQSQSSKYGVSVGYYAGSLSDGDDNVYIGKYAGYNSLNGSDNNIYLGVSAGYSADGSNNIELMTESPGISILDGFSNRLNIENTIVGDMGSRRLAIGLVGSGDLSPDATIEIKPSGTATVGLIVQATASHTANLAEFQDASETNLVTIGAGGATNVSGLLTAATGVTLQRNTPATTTDKLYNVAGALYFNGSGVGGGGGGTSYTAGTGLTLVGTEFNTTGTGYFDRLGIGTDSPTYELDVAGDIGVDEYIYHNGEADTYIRFRDDQFDFVVGGLKVLTLFEGTNDKVVVNEGGNNVDFRVESNNDADLIRTDAANDLVGIGTGTPSYLLDVAGTGSFNTVRWADGTTQATSATGDISTVSGLTVTNATNIASTGATNAADISTVSGLIQTYTAGTGLALVGTEFNTTGTGYFDRLGIGTDSPTYQLDVAGDAGFNEYIYHNGDADTYLQFDTDEINFVVGAANMIYMNEGGGGAQADKVAINNDLADVDFQVKGDNDANLFRTDAANDKVGIGTSTPAYKLEVSGSIGAHTGNFDVLTFNNSIATINNSGDATFRNLTTSGNLHVSGTLTYIDSTTVTIADKQLELASNSGAAISGDAYIDDGGIVLKSTDSDKKWTWLDATDAWHSTENISLASSKSLIFGDSTTQTTSATGDISTVSGLTVTNATSIASTGTTNAAAIVTNTTNIASTGATNAAAIATNITNIATNVTNIASTGATNAAAIVTNTTNIASTGATNAAAIATNVTNIATNVTNIAATGATNAAAITTNTTNIASTGATNAAAIVTNTTNIASTGATNAAAIATNVTNIATNVTNIAATGATNSADIDTVSGLIQTYTANTGLTLVGNEFNTANTGNFDALTFTDDHIMLGTKAGAGAAGSQRVSIGYGAGEEATGDYRVSIGHQAGSDAKTSLAYGDICIGRWAGQSVSGDYPGTIIAVGVQAGNSSDGKYSIYMGEGAGYGLSSQYGISLGYWAGTNGDGDSTVYIGRYAGYTAVNCDHTIGLGRDAGKSSNGDRNIFVGNQAGENCVGSHNIEIVTEGASTSILDDHSNAIHIENTIMGSTDLRRLAIGLVVAGDEAPDATLEIKPSGTATVGFIVQAAASHTANLTEWQNSSETVLASVAADGATSVSGLITAATGVALQRNTPATTTDKLYNVAGDLYFNGSAIADAADVASTGATNAAAIATNVTNIATNVTNIASTGTTNAAAIVVNTDAITATTGNPNNQVVLGNNANLSSNLLYGRVSIGQNAGSLLTAGGRDGVFIGYYAGRGATGGERVAIGDMAGDHISYGGAGGGSTHCVDIGYFAGRQSDHDYSVCIGPWAGNLMPADRAVAIGMLSMYSSANCYRTIGIGENAGRSSDGQRNIYIGYQPGRDCAGSYNIEIVTEGAITSILDNHSHAIHIENTIMGSTDLRRLAIGLVVAGDEAPDATLEIKPSGTATVGLIVQATASQTANLTEWQDSSETVLASVDEDGNLTATSKSFLIDHPTKEGKQLRYASLEGPEHGVYVRGHTDTAIIDLPEYWTELVDEASITVNITSKDFAQPSLFVSGILDNKVYLQSDGDISSYYMINATRKDIYPLEVEI